MYLSFCTVINIFNTNIPYAQKRANIWSCCIVVAVNKEFSRKILFVLLVSALCCGCNAQQPSQPLKLPSGRVVRVLGEGPINFSKGPPALMLKYETSLQVADAEKLRSEADEVFGILKIDAAKGNFTLVIVSANEKPSGMIFKSSQGYNFVYEKRADGQWRCLDDDKRNINE